jgi:SAM-dependent methyltransferase
MSKGTECFTPLAEDYARYRPGYPTGVLDVLTRVCGLTPDWVVADIGSGTGNLARLFLANGNQVTGVEPNREMRELAEHLLAEYRGFRSLDGTAENIPLEASSVDLITVGQALHWFDVDRARAEFRRILRPGGWVAVLWNDQRSDVSAFAQEYGSIRRMYASAQPASDAAPSLDTGIDRFFGSVVPHEATFQHTKRFDLEGFLGRVRSSGFLPQPGASGHAELTALLTDLFVRHQCEGVVEFHYTAQLYLGHLDG